MYNSYLFVKMATYTQASVIKFIISYNSHQFISGKQHFIFKLPRYTITRFMQNKLKEKHTQHSAATMKLDFCVNEMTCPMSMQNDLSNDQCNITKPQALPLVVLQKDLLIQGHQLHPAVSSLPTQCRRFSVKGWQSQQLSCRLAV